MKRTILILAGIAILVLLLIARLLFTQKNGMKNERQWFAKSVRYEFSARVDSVFMLNQNAGRLRCVLTEGNPQIEREDSLKKLFKRHDMLYLIYKQSADTITFILPKHASIIAKGDSVHVSSRKNIIQFFRTAKPLVADSLTETLTGFGRPFFLKNK